MPDLFLAEDVQALLRNKKVALMGCSNVRAMYKDLVTLYQGDHIISGKALKTKMEESFMSDCLVCHGKKHNGRDYREERVFQTEDVSISFYFLTRVYSDYVEGILRRMVLDPPDIIVVSSCLWDICRWGPNGVMEYKENLRLLFREFTHKLPNQSLIIWLTTAPIAQEVNGGFLVSQLEFLQYSLRFHVLEANSFCAEIAESYRVDVVDIHYHLRMLLDLRAEDGIHWTPLAVRLSTNLLLTHIAISLGLPLPKRTVDCYTSVEREELSASNTPATGQLQKGALDSTLPNDISYGQIFGQDQRVVQEMKRNATEMAATPRRAKRQRGQYRQQQNHYRSYSQGRYGSYRYQS